MATTFADLEARVRGLESRTSRNEEDITVIISTVSETLTEVRYLKKVTEAIAEHLGVPLPPRDNDLDE